MGILAWLLFGLIIGALAKLVMPGNQNMGWLLTIILGIVGAFVGGFIGSNLLGIGEDGNMWDIGSIAMSVLGAILVLVIYGAVTKGK
ncbi:GlsB/YeaQ/YmgE family stress response membrane protein [Frigoriflavimonas asaccharolytica]|uniref:Putative membrane protein YeaQ/YmgE (Transglycosylase-associated protein family) n=1 Tax=Frigoriflavimonas asaccharolytica TaxID=2735899 RepID=A0A8J8G7M5_9FLAO|nr:GlsB/YeaQ/YmgE family stress response membrane protein [Frigoriflavimonas asaccharolytica]NRS92983.1 putative membrane protein YeaQ/YmgE (transglycosylase-associated protein family) [Frigoriflavimonas asaccharolytica]